MRPPSPLNHSRLFVCLEELVFEAQTEFASWNCGKCRHETTSSRRICCPTVDRCKRIQCSRIESHSHVSVYLHLKDGEDVWERTKLLTLRCFCSLEPVIYSCIPNKFWSLYSIWSGLKTVKNNINVQLSSKCYLNHHKTKCNVKMAEAVICG